MKSLIRRGSRLRCALVTLASLAVTAVPIGIFAFNGFRYLNFLGWAAVGIAVWAIVAARSGFDPRSASYEESLDRGSKFWRSLAPRMRYDFMAFKVMLALFVLLFLALAVDQNLVAGVTSFMGAFCGPVLYNALRT